MPSAPAGQPLCSPGWPAVGWRCFPLGCFSDVRHSILGIFSPSIDCASIQRAGSGWRPLRNGAQSEKERAARSGQGTLRRISAHLEPHRLRSPFRGALVCVGFRSAPPHRALNGSAYGGNKARPVPPAARHGRVTFTGRGRNKANPPPPANGPPRLLFSEKGSEVGHAWPSRILRHTASPSRS